MNITNRCSTDIDNEKIINANFGQYFVPVILSPPATRMKQKVRQQLFVTYSALNIPLHTGQKASIKQYGMAADGLIESKSR